MFYKLLISTAAVFSCLLFSSDH